MATPYVEKLNAPGPLDGVRVLDFTRVLSGPSCGRALADLGADVIKIEPPEGDVTRFTFPKIGGITTYLAQQAAGKRNVSVDLATADGQELARRLVATADVVLENYRPGVMSRLGLGFDELHRLHPRLIMASISGYGQTGVWAQRRAYAPVIQAEMGMLMSNSTLLNEPVRQDALSHADVYAGLEAAIGILSALYMRERTNTGQHVDVSMAESMLWTNEHAAWYLSGIDVTDNVASMSPWEAMVAPTGNGVLVTIAGDMAAAGTFNLWRNALGAPLSEDLRFAEVTGRIEHRGAMQQVVSDWLLGWTDLYALDRFLESHGLAMGVVRTLADVEHEEWAIERHAFVTVGKRDGSTNEFKVPRSPWRFSEASSMPGNLVAYRGEHNRELCAELGYTVDEIAALETSGALSSRLPKTP